MTAWAGNSTPSTAGLGWPGKAASQGAEVGGQAEEQAAQPSSFPSSQGLWTGEVLKGQ